MQKLAWMVVYVALLEWFGRKREIEPRVRHVAEVIGCVVLLLV